ncbi:RNA polymerase sigma factor [Lentzea flava]|uniref:RNA polymerase sigma24 factor n=1 Tax=Lentzea flava TaxID=103732 RepID=A0ABQ2UJI6_9PSEU|nr:sigma factor-like helix-turn-helix DNA-binding protein [Lentzea flava]MCP2199900.1 RNA polymerase sigma-70 factor, ECF subfamily [Lentzea flava]GGU40103.1 RNA polymerase sigma24 factor [Lentzea flava]
MDGEPIRQIEAAANDPVLADFSAFYRSEVGRVVGYVVKMTGASVHEAADAAQTALALAWEHWDRITYPRAWVRTVAVREARRSLADQRAVDDRALLPPEAIFLPGAKWQLVVAALAALPLAQRQVLALTADGFSDEEIARELQTTPQAVRQSRSRGRRLLKAVLARKGWSYE